MKKSRVIQTVWIVVFAICTAFSAFISVLACIPESNDVEIMEAFSASASKATASGSDYRIDVVGALKNNTEDALTVDRLKIVLEEHPEGELLTVVVDSITIEPRNAVTVSKSRVADGAYGRIESISATVNGKTEMLRNSEERSLVAVLIPLAVTAVLAFLLVRSCKVRYYMMQEDRADRVETPAED